MTKAMKNNKKKVAQPKHKLSQQLAFGAWTMELDPWALKLWSLSLEKK